MRQTLVALVLVAGCVPPPPPVAPAGPGAPRAEDGDQAASDVRRDVIDPQPPRDWCDELGQDPGIWGTWDGAVTDAAAREP